ncbi:MAG TPA: thioredoxin family protein [Blastocatellia bacterium]|nr:thioredoxin family protein [Blastocatellia bacterium]
MKAITTDTFDAEVRQALEPVLVDFWGPRCAPCLALMPAVEKLADQYEGRLKVVKVNASENRKLCIQLRVLGLPTFLLFIGGNEVARKTGEIKAGELPAWIEETLLQSAQKSN